MSVYKKRLILLRLSFIIWGIILGIVGAELFLKVQYANTLDAHDSAWTVKFGNQLDNELIYSYVPNFSSNWKKDEFDQHVSINEIGCRSQSLPKVKYKSEYRIFFIGDSYTFGQGISKNELTYPALFENYLKNTNITKKDIRVYNCGVQGYSPDQEYRLIEKKIIKYKPDLIIWNLLNPSDLYELTHTYKDLWNVPALYTIKNNKLTSLNAKLNWLYFQNWITKYTPEWINNSYVFKMLMRKISMVDYFNWIPRIPEQKKLEWASQKLYLEIEQVDLLSKQHNFDLWIVMLPAKDMFTNALTNLQFVESLNYIGDKAKNKGIKVVNLYDEIQQFSKKSQNLKVENLFFKNDSHPTEEGAELFAKTLLSVFLSDDIMK